jgi:hypothetical protein
VFLTLEISDLKNTRFDSLLRVRLVYFSSQTRNWKRFVIVSLKSAFIDLQTHRSLTARLTFGSVVLKLKIFLCYKTGYLSEEVNCTEPFPSGNDP